MDRLNEKQRQLAAGNLALVSRAIDECELEDGDDRDELYSAGCLGLCEAAAQYGKKPDRHEKSVPERLFVNNFVAGKFGGDKFGGDNFVAFAMPVIKEKVRAALESGRRLRKLQLPLESLRKGDLYGTDYMG